MYQLLHSKKILFPLLGLFTFFAMLSLASPGRTFFPDEKRFIGEAKSIAETGQFVVHGKARAWEMPLTGMLYAPFYKIFNSEAVFIKAVRVFQGLLHILTATGAATLAWALFQKRFTAVFVLFSMAIYPSLVAYQFTLLSECPFICAFVWGFAFLALWQREGKNWWFLMSILTFMVSFYIKAVVTFMLPILIASASLLAAKTRGARVRYTLLTCLLFIVCASPWWIRNWTIFHRFVPLTTSASWNLYLGNNSRNKTAEVAGPTSFPAEENAAIQALGDELEISMAYSNAAKGYILANKATFLHNAWLKFKRFYNFRSNYTGEENALLFKLYNIASLLSWGIVCPLALISFVLNRRMWSRFLPRFLPIYLMIAYYTSIHVVTIATLRYRLPIEPLFLVVAADCVGTLWEQWGQDKHVRKTQAL